MIFHLENRKLNYEPRKRWLSIICHLSFQVVLKVRKRVTMMLLTVTVIFAICWSADAILHLLERFHFHKNLPLGRGIIHATLAFNAALNPFAYALINQRFRAKLTELLSSSVCSRTERVHSLRPRKSYDINMVNEIHSIENRKQAQAGVVGTSSHQTSRQTTVWREIRRLSLKSSFELWFQNLACHNNIRA